MLWVNAAVLRLLLLLELFTLSVDSITTRLNLSNINWVRLNSLSVVLLLYVPQPCVQRIFCIPLQVLVYFVLSRVLFSLDVFFVTLFDVIFISPPAWILHFGLLKSSLISC